MFDKIKRIYKKENTKNILILLFVSCIICIPLLNTKLNITYDDGVQHIARLMGTYQSLGENQNFSVIMSRFCNNFGYSWNIFYSPITAYGPLIFKIIGLSFINCIKVFIFFITFMSGITMYFFTKEITKNKKIALISGIIYLFAPYRFTDMYIRNALAELTTFVFLPMVFQGLYGILKQKPKREYILIIGAVGLILTHTIVTIYVAIISLVYIITQFKELKNRKVRDKIILSLLFIILISSFFWAPLLEHKTNTQYEVFKEGRMERTEVLKAFKLGFEQLFITFNNNIMIFEIGLLNIIVLILTPIVIKKLKRKYINTDFYRFYKFALILAIILIIMTLKIFPFEYLPSILKMIQFSFRLLEFTSFLFAFIVGVNIYVLIRKIKYKDIFIIIAILTISSLAFLSHLQFSDNIDENKLWPAVAVTNETGRVHRGCASFEYLPSKAFENRSYIETREDKIIVLEGNATIENEQKNLTNLICDITNIQEETKIELPYIYYLGYRVIIEDGINQIQLNTYETDNGFVGVTIPKAEKIKLNVNYEGTFTMKACNFISILGIIILITRVVLVRIKDIKEKTKEIEN